MTEGFERVRRLLIEANASIEPPGDLIGRIEERLAAEARRQRRRRWVAPLAAAAVLLLGVIGAAAAFLLPRAGRQPTERLAADEHVPLGQPDPRDALDSVRAATVARLAFTPESRLFARPIASENPDVSILFVYRDIRRSTP